MQILHYSSLQTYCILTELVSKEAAMLCQWVSESSLIRLLGHNKQITLDKGKLSTECKLTTATV